MLSAAEKLDLINSVIADSIEFGDSNSAEYLRATQDCIGAIIGFQLDACKDDKKNQCLHKLIGDEARRLKDFKLNHNPACKNTTDFSYDLICTGIGEAIYVKCPMCGVRVDITDNSKW